MYEKSDPLESRFLDLGQSLLGSESVGWDLTPIGIMVRGVGLPLPCREGHGFGFYLVRWGGRWQSKGSVGRRPHGCKRPRYSYEADWKLANRL